MRGLIGLGEGQEGEVKALTAEDHGPHFPKWWKKSATELEPRRQKSRRQKSEF